MIDGVVLTPIKHIPVAKGDIYHALKSSEATYCGFGEAYFSEIIGGEVKGWKKHKRMTLNIIPVNGAIGFVIYDEREDSPTKGQFQEIVLSRSDNYQRLTVPAGVWMAFYGAIDGSNMLMDIIPEPHDPDEAERCEINDIKYVFPCGY